MNALFATLGLEPPQTRFSGLNVFTPGDLIRFVEKINQTVCDMANDTGDSRTSDQFESMQVDPSSSQSLSPLGTLVDALRNEATFREIATFTLQAGSNIPSSRLAYRIDYFQSGDNRITLRGQTNEIGTLELFLPRNQGVLISLLDPIKQTASIFPILTSASASTQRIKFGHDFSHVPSLLDTDGDGLFDLSEIILGTSVAFSDSDRDGLSDYAEILIGQTL